MNYDKESGIVTFVDQTGRRLRTELKRLSVADQHHIRADHAQTDHAQTNAVLVNTTAQKAQPTEQAQPTDEVQSVLMEAEAEVAYLRGRDLYNLYGIFHELDMTLGNYQPGADLAGSPFYGPRIQWARDASRELSASEPTDKRYPFDSFQYHAIEGTTATKVPAEVFRLAGQRMRTGGIDLPFLTTALEQLSLAIGGGDEEQAVRTVLCFPAIPSPRLLLDLRAHARFRLRIQLFHADVQFWIVG